MVDLHNDTDSISSSIVIALNEVIQKIHQLSNVLFVYSQLFSWLLIRGHLFFVYWILYSTILKFIIFNDPRMLNVQYFLQEIFIKYIGWCFIIMVGKSCTLLKKIQIKCNMLSICRVLKIIFRNLKSFTGIYITQ